jgi:hypothetical protein
MGREVLSSHHYPSGLDLQGALVLGFTNFDAIGYMHPVCMAGNKLL